MPLTKRPTFAWTMSSALWLRIKVISGSPIAGCYAQNIAVLDKPMHNEKS